jgi:hypothetical protein
VTLVAACAYTTPAGTQATQDSVTGSGAAGTGTFEISAVSGPSGENPSGSVSFDLAIGTLLGSVTLLCVDPPDGSASEAINGGEVLAGSTATEGVSYLLYVRDAEVDLLSLSLSGGSPSTFCPSFSIASPAGVTSGNVTVINALPTIGELLDALREDVATVTSPGVRTSLATKVDAAAEAVAAGNTPQACRQLTAFLGEVRALSRAGLTIEEAFRFRQQAETTADRIGC